MRLAERADQRRLEFGVPALAAAVISSDAIETAVVGMRRADSEDPGADDDRFHIGSSTKAMTASVHSGSADTFYAVVVLQAERNLAVAAITNASGERAHEAAVELTRELIQTHRG